MAICIISAGALVSLAQCKSFDEKSSCNCSTFDEWHDAVVNPNPDDNSCQFPQVCFVLLKKYALCINHVFCCSTSISV